MLHNSYYFSALKHWKMIRILLIWMVSRKYHRNVWWYFRTMNMTFSDFMLRAFNSHRGDVIKGWQRIGASKDCLSRKRNIPYWCMTRKADDWIKTNPENWKPWVLDLKDRIRQKSCRIFLRRFFDDGFDWFGERWCCNWNQTIQKRIFFQTGMGKRTPKAVNGLDAYALKAMKSEKKSEYAGAC